MVHSSRYSSRACGQTSSLTLGVSGAASVGDLRIRERPIPFAWPLLGFVTNEAFMKDMGISQAPVPVHQVAVDRLRRWRAGAVALVLAATFAGSDAIGRAVGPSTTVTSDQLETETVSISGAGRHKEDTWCHDASVEQPFVQRALATSVAFEDDAAEARCTLELTGYVAIATGVEEPTRACVRRYVSSGSGLVHLGQSGRLRCNVTLARYAEPQTPVPLGLDGPLGKGDSIAVLASLPADLTLRRSDRSSAIIAMPLRGLQQAIDKALREMPATDGLKITPHAARIQPGALHASELALYADVEVESDLPTKPSARCEITSRFAIPPSTPLQLTVQELGSVVTCRSGGALLNLLDVPNKLASKIRSEIGGIFAKVGPGSGLGDLFKEWASEDPELGQHLATALLQGRICQWRGEPALCVAIGWEAPLAMAMWESSLLAKTPTALGPADRSRAAKQYAALADWAMVHQRRPLASSGCPAGEGCPPQACDPGPCFMTGLKDDLSLEDGDMLVFSGIACAGGVEEGCRLVRAAQDQQNGRFWRSPWRAGDLDSPDHATFSGDQLKGVLHYFARANLDPQDAERLRAFLRYLASQPTQVPSDQVPLERGYSSCTQRAPNFTCLVGGDWTLLQMLAVRHGVQADMPPDLPVLISRYGISLDTLVWEALMTNTGYRLHLVANTAWLLRTLAPQDERIERAIAIIAARQPDNPFFLWLQLGSDIRVQQLVDMKCPVPPKSAPRMDWAWQRAEIQKRWERSMVWDCVFMNALLAK